MIFSSGNKSDSRFVPVRRSAISTEASRLFEVRVEEYKVIGTRDGVSDIQVSYSCPKKIGE
jgi:hypothetical protein